MRAALWTVLVIGPDNSQSNQTYEFHRNKFDFGFIFLHPKIVSVTQHDHQRQTSQDQRFVRAGDAVLRNATGR